MNKNMGTKDKMIRVIIVMLIGTLIIVNVIEGVLAIILLVFAAILLATVFFSFCPLYFPFGIKTNQKEEDN